jgi:hypothetical protein
MLSAPVSPILQGLPFAQGLAVQLTPLGVLASADTWPLWLRCLIPIAGLAVAGLVYLIGLRVILWYYDRKHRGLGRDRRGRQ